MEMLAYATTTDVHFIPATPEMERFQQWPADSDFTLTETSYFGFNIGALALQCEIYHWYHPMLKVCSGGVMIYKGKKPIMQAAEYCNYTTFMPMPDEMIDTDLPSGVRIDMLEPNRKFRIRYEDKAADTRLDFISEAMMPLPIRVNSGHLAQVMKNTGELVLRGERHEIGGYFLRDRSWGDPRPEHDLPIPALGWNGAAFDDDYAFHLIAFDSPRYHPDWATKYPRLRDGENHLWGWIWKDGELRGIASADQHQFHEADGIYPDRTELRITDTAGEVHEFKGKAIAGLPFNAWHNMNTYYGMGIWECGDRRTYGTLQNCVWNDYAQSSFVPRGDAA